MTKLLDEKVLLHRLQELLAASTRVDIAMAWIRRGSALDAILAFAGAHPGRVRVICGVNNYLTEPEALMQLNESTQLKIAYGTSGQKLHAKLLIFKTQEASIAWVGSANLTEPAFSTNREIVCEFADDGRADELFKNYWNEFRTPAISWLEEYAQLCKQAPSETSIRHLDAPTGLLDSKEWTEYVLSLRLQDEQRLKWLAGHLPEVTTIALSDWQTLSKPDAEKLLGLTGYGGLGNLSGAGVIKNIFFRDSWKNLQTRAKMRSELDAIPLDHLAPAFEKMLQQAFENVTDLPGIGVATVTRLLALMHPDRFVSVNGASIAGLSQLSGISQTDLRTSTGYVALISWVTKQAWWSAPRPEGDTSVYWSQRAALLDILAYAKDSSKRMEPGDE